VSGGVSKEGVSRVLCKDGGQEGEGMFNETDGGCEVKRQVIFGRLRWMLRGSSH